jgi:hypothetical protein
VVPNTEVEFEETERRLLDWLESQASRRDGVVIASDTLIIRQLKLEDEPERFFAAKMRLVTAGMIRLFVSPRGDAGIQLNQRKRTDVVSKRYALLVVPLELVPEIIDRTRAWRQEAFAPGSEKASPPKPREASPGFTPRTPEERRQQVQARLGVRLLAPGPIRPPVKIA